ncbi:MAG TPA: hypothetical protein O0Y17_03740, partial [Methanocorpusculum sp.]|nr:hypothetical protein [Methanocorpusculum sp.]
MTVNTGMNSTGKIAKGLLCAFLFVLLSAFLLAGVCAAETQNITFVGGSGERTITIDYDEAGYFSSDAETYNLKLAQASLAMAAAASSSVTDHYAESDDAAKEYRCGYLKSAYTQLGFSESKMKFYNYDKSLNSTDDKVAYGIAHKTISVGGNDWTLFAV